MVQWNLHYTHVKPFVINQSIYKTHIPSYKTRLWNFFTVHYKSLFNKHISPTARLATWVILKTYPIVQKCAQEIKLSSEYYNIQWTHREHTSKAVSQESGNTISSPQTSAAFSWVFSALQRQLSAVHVAWVASNSAGEWAQNPWSLKHSETRKKLTLLHALCLSIFTTLHPVLRLPGCAFDTFVCVCSV